MFQKWNYLEGLVYKSSVWVKLGFFSRDQIMDFRKYRIMKDTNTRPLTNPKLIWSKPEFSNSSPFDLDLVLGVWHRLWLKSKIEKV